MNKASNWKDNPEKLLKSIQRKASITIRFIKTAAFAVPIVWEVRNNRTKQSRK